MPVRKEQKPSQPCQTRFRISTYLLAHPYSTPRPISSHNIEYSTVAPPSARTFTFSDPNGFTIKIVLGDISTTTPPTTSQDLSCIKSSTPRSTRKPSE